MKKIKMYMIKKIHLLMMKKLIKKIMVWLYQKLILMIIICVFVIIKIFQNKQNIDKELQLLKNIVLNQKIKVLKRKIN